MESAKLGSLSDLIGIAKPRKTYKAARRDENFKKWFGESKAVDEAGKPLTLYKAMSPYDSSKGFVTTGFQKRPDDAYPGPEITSINRQSEFPAFHGDEPGVKLAGFFGDKDVAARFNKVHGGAAGGAATFPVHLAFHKPYIVDAKGKRAGEMQFGESGKPWRDAMRSDKYDSSIIRNTADEGHVYVAKHPTQIKSAIGNSGRFDPKNPDINE